jgi:hypothetical protein
VPPAPQRHAPAGEQLSARALLHTTHEAASVPQDVKPEFMHALFEQHPFGHDVELHTHAPLEQICPASHGGPDPHWQAPLVHRSDWVGEHTVHAPPLVPHVEGACDSQVAPLQHPFGHVALHPVHTLLTQFWVDPHGLQSEPPPPQAVPEVPGRQVVPEQHPVGHDVPLHTHAPLTHA